uniref:Arabinogalactan peptide 13-like n=1 Tax=Nelumbo nucifera TaxID=4432 RepID=A0A822YUW6_NELNU|nr:TPA_asm: hypothetical protein HUJ06_006988 [Nelumbo nucifera]
MAVSRVSFGVVAIVALIFAVALPAVQAQSVAPAPAPTSDGTFFVSVFWFPFHFFNLFVTSYFR